MKDESEFWAEVKHQQRRRRRRIVVLIAGIVLLIPIIIAAAIGIRHVYLGHQIQAELTKIRQEGYPTNVEELNQWYKTPPDGENAADLLVQAYAQFVPPSKEEDAALPIVGEAKLPARNQPLSPEMKKAIADYLAKNAAALELLHKGAGMKACRYPGTLSLLGDMPHLVKVREGARLLRLEGVFLVEENDPKGAVKAVVDGVALGRTLTREPKVISVSTGRAAEVISITGLERLLSRIPFTETQFTELSTSLDASEDNGALLRGWWGERACASSFFEDPSVTTALGGGFFEARYKAMGRWKADHLFLLEAWRETMNVAQTPLPGRLLLAKNLGPELERRVVAGRHAVTAQVFPSVDGFITREARWAAFSRCAQLSLGIERYRLRTGRTPDTLDALVPEYLVAVPQDPFDGQPLRYKQRENGYVVYSLGVNLRDDGGKERVQNEGDTTCDETFTVER
jgi:hypothetical protein